MRRSLTLLAWCLLLSHPSFAVAPKEHPGPLDRIARSDPSLRPAAAVVEPIESAGAALSPGVTAGWSAFLQKEGSGWQGYADRRTGLLETAEGSGIPWIPGAGNQLTSKDVATYLTGAEVNLQTLERIARAFLPRVAPLLGVDPGSLRLSPGRSGESGGYLWLIDFDVLRDGRPIEGARVVFRVNNGNLVQFGSENLPAASVPTPRERVTRQEALATLGAYIGGFDARDTFVDNGTLHLLPIALADSSFGDGFAPGSGRGLALVWQLSFRRQGELGTWRARIDATTGKLLEFVDVNRYGRVMGGVYRDSPAIGGEVELPMPFAGLSTGGFADAAGRFDFSGSPVSATLSGPYVRIADDCGPISQSANAAGSISFGGSAGTDCATPGFGGAGNSHAARTQFYHSGERSGQPPLLLAWLDLRAQHRRWHPSHLARRLQLHIPSSLDNLERRNLQLAAHAWLRSSGKHGPRGLHRDPARALEHGRRPRRRLQSGVRHHRRLRRPHNLGRLRRHHRLRRLPLGMVPR